MKIKKNHKIIVAVSCALLLAFCLVLAFFPMRVQAEAGASPNILFKTGKNTTVTSNVDVPEYAQEGYYSIGENDYATKQTLPAWRTNGVLVKTKSETESLEFKNIIDLNTLDENSCLISLMPLTSERFGTNDMTTLVITLTDADDPSNWVALHISTMDYIDLEVVKVRTSFYLSSSKYKLKPNIGALRTCADFNTFFGITRLIDWRAMSVRDQALIAEGKEALGEKECIYYHDTEESLVKPYSIYFNPETNDLLYDNHMDEKTLIYNLSDTASVGVGNEFKGFKNGRVRISVNVTGINKTEVGYMVLNVAGHGMNGATVADTVAPSYLENLPLYKEELPVAMVNRPYNLFDVEFYDVIDGELAPKIYVKAPQEDSFKEVVNSFTPVTAGDYVVRYVGIDVAGNTRKVEYIVIAEEEESIEPLSLQIDKTAESYNIGEEIFMPVYQAVGGSGNITVEVETTRLADGKEISLNNGVFVPRFAGVYEIEYTARDYLNTVTKKSVWCNVVDKKSPVISSEIKMYKKFVSGIKTELPKANAYDYTLVAGQKMNAVTEITVRGVGEKSSVIEKVNNHIFTPSIEKFGKNIVIEYKIYCQKYPENAIVLPFESEIYQPAYIYEYFSFNKDDIEVKPNANEEKATIFKSLKQEGDVGFSFVNPLRAEYFEVGLSVLPEEDEFNDIKISLIDSFNAKERVELLLKKYTTAQSILSYNGKEILINGGIGVSDSSIAFYYSKGALYSNTGVKIMELNGFEGFASGKVWAEVSIVDIYGNAAVRLSKLGTQSLAVRYRKDSTTSEEYMVKFKDSLSPEIELAEGVVSEAIWGTNVRIPYAKAYDVCSQYMEVNFMLTDPDGEILYDETPVGYGKSFKAEKYGTYILKYTTKDQVGIKKEITYYIDVFDLNAPIIDYDGEKTIEIRSGETCEFFNASVYDAFDTSPTLRVFVITADYEVYDVTDSMKYTFAKKGNYVVRYYAYDSSYNVTCLDITVSVE